MDVSALLGAIANVIKENGNNEITGTVLQSVFTQLVNVLNAGKQDTLTAGAGISIVGNTISAPATDLVLHIALPNQPTDEPLDFPDRTKAEIISDLGLTEAQIDKLFSGGYNFVIIDEMTANRVVGLGLMYSDTNAEGGCAVHYHWWDGGEAVFDVHYDLDLEVDLYNVYCQ